MYVLSVPSCKEKGIGAKKKPKKKRDSLQRQRHTLTSSSDTRCQNDALQNTNIARLRKRQFFFQCLNDKKHREPLTNATQRHHSFRRMKQQGEQRDKRNTRGWVVEDKGDQSVARSFSCVQKAFLLDSTLPYQTKQPFPIWFYVFGSECQRRETTTKKKSIVTNAAQTVSPLQYKEGTRSPEKNQQRSATECSLFFSFSLFIFQPTEINVQQQNQRNENSVTIYTVGEGEGKRVTNGWNRQVQEEGERCDQEK